MAESKYLMQSILSKTRKAVQDYDLIKEGDRVCVGVSGGKDSLTLLAAMANLRRFYPKHFDLEAVSVGLGFPSMDYAPVRKFAEDLEVPFTFVDTKISEIVFDIRDEKNPCALCANLRRGALNDKAHELGCNVVALGHHKNDVIGTALLSLFYEGRFYCFDPATYLDRSMVNVIRPFIYVEETEIRQYAKAAGLPVVTSACPMDKDSKRAYIKTVISDLEKSNRGLSTNIFGAVARGVWPPVTPVEKTKSGR